MDNETVDKKGGKVTEFTIIVARKVWTENPNGSFEVSIGETVSVGSEEDYVELERASFKELKDKVLKAAVLDNAKMSPVMVDVSKMPKAHPDTMPQPRDTAKKHVAAKNAPPEEDDYIPGGPDPKYKSPPPPEEPPDEAGAFANEEVRVPIDDKGQEKIVFLVEKINVYAMPSGDKGAKAKGKMVNPGQNIAYHGNYMRHGVQVWPEVMAKEPLEWDLEAMEIGEINAPPGLTAVCPTKEKVEKDGTMKGELIPTKVEEWK